MSAKNNILTLLFALCALCAKAQTSPVLYGYSPTSEPGGTDISALGSGENGNVSALICLDPQTDPVMQRLKGKQIIGVRCYLRNAYEQEFDERSFIQLYEGAISGTPTRKYVDFAQGWNTVYFDSPVTIGDEKLYVGMQVLETIKLSYPVVAYSKITVPGSCWIRLGNHDPWSEYTDRGTPLIQAILSDDCADLLNNTAYACVASAPLTIAPSTPTTMQVYVHNLSPEPASQFSLAVQGQGDEAAHTMTLTAPLAAYDAATVTAQVTPGSEEGASQWLKLNVTAIDGTAAQSALTGETKHYVTKDAYTRIPLIEEFTGQTCTNCPYMAYYLDLAREESGIPHVYVAHHAGYSDDAFTTQADKDLLYLFGDQGTFNPAVTYNRSYLTGENYAVLGAHNEPSSSNYIDDLTEASEQPAMAKVLVDADLADGQLTCRVYGQVNRSIAAGTVPVYLTAYVIEDSLTTDIYPQWGLDVDDIPEEAVKRFRHNGVIRKSLTTNSLGDQLTFDSEANFDVTFPAVSISDAWNWKNCQVVAFVHYTDESNLRSNTVLNAGGNRMNRYVTAIHSVSNSAAPAAVHVYASADGHLHASEAVASLAAYTLSGRRVNTALPLTPGIYMVQPVSLSGQALPAQKVLVR